MLRCQARCQEAALERLCCPTGECPVPRQDPATDQHYRIFNKSMYSASEYDYDYASSARYQYLPPNVEPYYEDLWRYLPANAFSWCELLARCTEATQLLLEHARALLPAHASGQRWPLRHPDHD